MKRVRLICWNANEAKQRAEDLRSEGYIVDAEIPRGATSLRELGKKPPLAIIIDLSRLPSQGRDIAVMLRKTKGTRQIPLIFSEGDPGKVTRIRKLLPDAVYTRWSRMRTALRRAISHPPPNPVAPKSIFEAYAGAPLVKKLGIKPGISLALLRAPEDFQEKITPLPDGARLTYRLSRQTELALWFNRSRREYESQIAKISSAIGSARLWIAWPKKEGRLGTDLTQQAVRKAGLAVGLVDYKICSIDNTWSALLFTRRKTKQTEAITPML